MAQFQWVDSLYGQKYCWRGACYKYQFGTSSQHPSYSNLLRKLKLLKRVLEVERKGGTMNCLKLEDRMKNTNNHCLIPPFLHIIHAPCREKAFNTMKRQKKTKYCKDLHRNGILPILVASCSNTRFSAVRWMLKANKSNMYQVRIKKVCCFRQEK